MKLDIKTIKDITLGAVNIEESSEGISFSRFTKEQTLYYKNQPNPSKMYIPPAGVKLCFKTDSENLHIKINVPDFSGRKYFSLDVFKNDEAAGFIDNFENVDLTGNYAVREYPMGEYEKTFFLGKGEKNIDVYLPFSVCFYIREITVDDKAYIKGIKPQKKLLAFGDSITQGYDSLRPSETYITRLSRFLDMELYNKGIGGEIFPPTLATYPDNFTPDIITVAYGTNYFWREKHNFIKECRDFFENLTKTYEGVKIFGITPIWRGDHKAETPFGDFDDIEKEIIKNTSHLSDITIISGKNLVPDSEEYFGDLKLHPTGEGFRYYAENLFGEIKKYL